MQTITVTVPVTATERLEQRNELARQEEQLSRANLARANRAAGKPEPKVGTSLFVSTARGLKVRGRAGLVFAPTPSEVKVVDLSDEEVVAKQKSGASYVNVHGAEQILADSNGEHTGLIVYATKSDAAAAPVASVSTEDLEAELARRKAASRPDGVERIKSSKAGDGKTDVKTGDAKTDGKDAK